MSDDGIFLRNSWYVAAWNHELIDGRKLARTILERPVVIYRGASGKVVALDDRCCHRAAPLSMGRIEGDDIRCMYHGMKFEPGGKCIQIPGQDMIPPKLGVRSYPVVERYNLIWIWMGDIEKADPNLIVDYPPLADPKWRGLPGYMHYKANWLLIVDNLSDFAHLAFVHTHTLGGSEEYAYKTKPVAIEKLDDGFRVERWHMSADPPPYHCKVIANKTDKIDRRNIGRMLDPRHLPARHDVCAGRPGRGEGRSGAGHAAISQRAVHDAGDAQHHAFLLELSARFRPRQPEHRAVAAQQPRRGF